MAIAVLFGILLILYRVFKATDEAGPPQGADVQIDGGTGAAGASTEAPDAASPPGAEERAGN